MASFGLLKVRDIIDILDGDIVFGNIVIDNNEIKISLPYLTKSDICSVAIAFGYDHLDDYHMSGISRWCVFQYLLNCCEDDKRIDELVLYLFSLDKFRKKLFNIEQNRVEEIRKKCINAAIVGINKILYFSRAKLVCEGNNLYIYDLDAEVVVECPKIKVLSTEYINEIRNKALKDFDNKDYDGVVTKSRTLIEEVLIKMIEYQKIEPPTSGKINDLYKIIKENYNLKQSPQLDPRINDLLSGINKIISSISEMRNVNSDSHGAGSRRIKISEHHTRLILNSAITCAEFFVSVYLNTISKQE